MELLTALYTGYADKVAVTAIAPMIFSAVQKLAAVFAAAPALTEVPVIVVAVSVFAGIAAAASAPAADSVSAAAEAAASGFSGTLPETFPDHFKAGK